MKKTDCFFWGGILKGRALLREHILMGRNFSAFLKRMKISVKNIFKKKKSTLR